MSGSEAQSSSGTLYIVATPIGNLEDISLRALRILKEVDLIAAEDTRHTRKLLSAYGIHVRLSSYFDHNEDQKTPYFIQRLLNGESIALVSDAGTPGISDPGYVVIRKAIEAHIPIISVPGPSAAITALTLAGLPVEGFVFLGFLNNKRNSRRQQIEGFRDECRTLVCYVSPHVLLKALADLRSLLGNRQVAVSRELTKKFEEVLRGTLDSVIEEFSRRAAVKGEFTLVIAGAEKKQQNAEDFEAQLFDELRKCLQDGTLSRRDAVKLVATKLRLPKNTVYQASLQL
ncbi:16S rRNA (cytidine(1402)-2'-O)-methyltransferase [candidate division KSB3 bacterium]|uniref:Ribosomal RNA small subunit methyltransferase I n=1 Tax=candidate division KSB3 bacterium TaxID=2044937 RepID=A0A2G6E1D1_9BACT|nr:MAG: 16S rRNA (cytidine(1402)-2'-O)-methyltransferase [candidate division KSB3 bacterium]PIE28523.1 MAG: 16S rRNA (cytidine(1402)-2'-O)-methyltransferase [candidate division KSB3 bacterium]